MFSGFLFDIILAEYKFKFPKEEIRCNVNGKKGCNHDQDFSMVSFDPLLKLLSHLFWVMR